MPENKEERLLSKWAESFALEPNLFLSYLKASSVIPYPGSFEEEVIKALKLAKEGKPFSFSRETAGRLKRTRPVACFLQTGALPEPLFGLAFHASAPKEEAESLLDLLDIYPDDIGIEKLLRACLLDETLAESLHACLEESQLLLSSSLRVFHDRYWALPKVLNHYFDAKTLDEFDVF